jgi:hypothetical protein
MKAAFKLKCVGCKVVETRQAEDCQEQPYCNKCYMPMVLVEVLVEKAAPKPKGRYAERR